MLKILRSAKNKDNYKNYDVEFSILEDTFLSNGPRIVTHFSKSE